ncbi:MAG TPA: LPS export ABC transporter periplasmic protein LptC [Burkholderiaceae bacterium]|nr:LPS export ABC transporter periplasmic protein LptC [Burkholderiaceae bacterium]
MRERIAPLLAIILLTVVVGTSYWYSRMMRIPRAAPPPTPGTPDVVVEHVVITQFDVHGAARNKLFAERLTHYEEGDDIELASPRLVSLRPDQPQLDARALRARIENAGERVHMMGSVLLTRAAADGEPAMRLSTEYLLALPDRDRFSTDRPVEMERGQSTIDAQSMVYDNIARTIDFQGDVRATFVSAPGSGAKQ